MGGFYAAEAFFEGTLWRGATKAAIPTSSFLYESNHEQSSQEKKNPRKRISTQQESIGRMLSGLDAQDPTGTLLDKCRLCSTLFPEDFPLSLVALL